MKRILPMFFKPFVLFDIIRVIRFHLTLIKKPSRCIAFIKDLPVVEVNILTDNQV